MKKLSLISLLLVACVILSACSSKATADFVEVGHSMPQMNGSFTYSASDDAGIFYTKNEVITESVMLDSAITAGGAGDDVALTEEKLVYTSNVTLETEDFDTATETLHNTIKSFGGIVVSESAYNLNSINKGYRSLSMTVRIPQENYDTFLSGISESYNVASIHNSVQNLTERYYDNENRLKSYRIQEERLFAMLEKAETVSEMLEIEARLCDVQYSIESHTNTKNTIDNDVKYATFYLNLNEVTKYTSPTPKTFGDRLAETFKNSGEMFKGFLEGALFFIILFAPYIVIVAVFVIIFVAAAKRKKKRLAAKNEKKDET